MKVIPCLLAGVTCLSLLSVAPSFAQSGADARPAAIKNVVLVHGAYADGSGWRGVSDILTHDGYQVSIVQEPETSLEDDVAATIRTIRQSKGPVILVGHSYGGVVITQAGNAPEVAGLVYIAAFAPDSDEDLGKLRDRFAPATNNVQKSDDGFLTLDRKTFHHDFAADLSDADADFMARSQVPVSVKALTSRVTQAAWHTKPSWYAVATEDMKINPDLERYMAKRAGSNKVEIKGSHAVFISQPQAVAQLIENAANGIKQD
jgi:pimeloyl-ACP methyl ester carboxylesterase